MPKNGNGFLRSAAGVQQNSANGGDAKNAEQNADEPDVQPHVAVQNVAEFVADNALQFVARQLGHAGVRDGDHRIARRVPGGKGVDAILIVEHIDFRHGHAGGDGHFLDDVEQFAFVRIHRVGINEPSAKGFRHHAATAGQRHRFIGAAEKNHGERAKHHAEKKPRVPIGDRRV